MQKILYEGPMKGHYVARDFSRLMQRLGGSCLMNETYLPLRDPTAQEIRIMEC